MNYIEKIKELLEKELKMVGTDYEDLLDIYELLILTVGENCTNEHIHDAWSVWQSKTEPEHRSLKPFEKLTKEVQDLDEPYRQAVIKVSKIIKHKKTIKRMIKGTKTMEKTQLNVCKKEDIREGRED